MKFTFKKNSQGYALPLALILVVIFSIVVANLGPRSNLFNNTQQLIIKKFKNDKRNSCELINPSNSKCSN
jgi:hypothetical protein